MSTLTFLYASWVPFLLVLPWMRRPWSLLRALLAPVSIGAAIALYTLLTFTLWPDANIRVDLLLLLPLLWLANLAGVVVLMVALLRRRPAAALPPPARLLGVVAVVGAAAFGAALLFEGVALSRETRQLGERFDRGHELLTAAKFRDRESLARAFGPVGSIEAEQPSLAGYWVPERVEETRAKRLIVTDDLRAWLYFPCDENYCERGPAELLVEPGSPDDAPATHARFSAGAALVELRIEPLEGDRLAGSVRLENGESERFTARRVELPPAAPVEESVTFLGSFSFVEELPSHQALLELELWRTEGRLFGFLLRTTPPHGQSQLVQPELLADVDFDPATGAFSLETDRGPVSGVLSRDGLELEWKGSGGERRERLVAGEARVDDAVFRLAPRTSHQAWLEWAQIAVPLARLSWTAAERPRLP